MDKNYELKKMNCANKFVGIQQQIKSYMKWHTQNIYFY